MAVDIKLFNIPPPLLNFFFYYYNYYSAFVIGNMESGIIIELLPDDELRKISMELSTDLN